MAMRPAIDVTRGHDAKHHGPSGGSVAGLMPQRRTQSAVSIVIEENNDDEEASVAKSFNGNERRDLRHDAMAIVGRAKTALAKIARQKAKQKSKEPNAKTIQNYRKKCEVIDRYIETLQEPTESPIRLALSVYAPKKQSFYAMKAALQWRSRTALEDGLRRLFSLGRFDSDNLQCILEIGKLQSSCSHHDELCSIELTDSLVLSGRLPRPARPKKLVLPRIEHNWRERFLEINFKSPKYRSAGVLLSFCGLRPAELAAGVRVERVNDVVETHILGAKVTDTSGQPWRSLALKAEMLPRWFLDELAGGPMTYTAKEDPMRTHLHRLSGQLYPNRKPSIILSAYVFRHAFATDLFDDGWPIEEVAAALGEFAAETASWYGTRRRGRTRRRQPTAIIRATVVTAREVRLPKGEWLAKLNEKKIHSLKLSAT